MNAPRTTDSHGPVAVVTGAATGLGRAIAFARSGMRVVVNYRDHEDEALKTKAAIEPNPASSNSRAPMSATKRRSPSCSARPRTHLERRPFSSVTRGSTHLESP